MIQDIKFELTNESIINRWGTKLFRIKATKDIKPRGVKKGDIGGFVKSTHLSNGEARIFGDAWVYDNAQVYGNAWVSGNAQVSEHAEIYGNAQVYDNAQVYGNALVYGYTKVYGYAKVFDNALVYGYAQIFENARVYGEARIFGDTWIYGYAQFSSDAQVYDASINSKKAFTSGKFVGCSDGIPQNLTVLHKEASDYWDNTYVLGDYEIKDIDEPEVKKLETIEISGKQYEVTDELTKALKGLKEV